MNKELKIFVTSYCFGTTNEIIQSTNKANGAFLVYNELLFSKKLITFVFGKKTILTAHL